MKKMLIFLAGLVISSSAIAMEPPLKKTKINAVFSRNQYLGIPDLPQDCINIIGQMVALNALLREKAYDTNGIKGLNTLGKYLLATSKSRNEFNSQFVNSLTILIDSTINQGLSPLQLVGVYAIHFRRAQLNLGEKESGFARHLRELESLPMIALARYLESQNGKGLYPNLIAQIKKSGYDYTSLHRDLYMNSSKSDQIDIYIENGDINSLQTILQEGISVYTDHLIKAIEKNNIDIVGLILKYSGFKHLKRPYNAGCAPLETALAMGNQKIIKLLKAFALSKFAPLKSVEEVIMYRMDRFNQHPVDLAFDLYPIFGPEVLTVLKNINAFDLVNHEIKEALEAQDIEKARIVLHAMYDSFLSAFQNQDMHEIERILKLGLIQPGLKTIEESMKSGNLELVKVLKDNIKDHHSLLKSALSSHNLDVLRIILELPDAANLSFSVGQGYHYPLEHVLYSYYEGAARQLEELLQAGANLDDAFPYGTAINVLFQKLKQKDLKQILPLVKDNFLKNINNQNNNGNTLLMNLIPIHGSLWKIKLLLKLGANISIRNKQNQTALTIAQEHEKPALIKVLLAAVLNNKTHL